MPKVELTDIRLGVSPLTDTVYAGVLDPKDKTLSTWKHHHDVNADFYRCMVDLLKSTPLGQMEIHVKGELRYTIALVEHGPATQAKQYLDPAQDVGQIAAFERECRVCHCTEMNACVTEGTPCHWVEEDLCSACRPMGAAVTLHRFFRVDGAYYQFMPGEDGQGCTSQPVEPSVITEQFGPNALSAVEEFSSIDLALEMFNKLPL